MSKLGKNLIDALKERKRKDWLHAISRAYLKCIQNDPKVIRELVNK